MTTIVIAHYWDENQGGIREELVPDWKTFTRILNSPDLAAENFDLLPVIELTNDNDCTCTLIRTRDQGCTITLADPAGKLSWPDEFDEESSDYIQYDEFGEFSEIPASVMIPCETAMRAVRAFIETGSIPSSLIEFVPEY